MSLIKGLEELRDIIALTVQTLGSVLNAMVKLKVWREKTALMAKQLE